MPALAAPAEETRRAGAADGSPELASLRAAYPGYDDTSARDGLRASEHWCLDAEGQTYLDYTGAGLPAQATDHGRARSAHASHLARPHCGRSRVGARPTR